MSDHSRNLTRIADAYQAARFLFPLPIKALMLGAWLMIGGGMIASRLGALSQASLQWWSSIAATVAIGGALLHWFFHVFFVRVKGDQGHVDVLMPLEQFSRFSLYRLSALGLPAVIAFYAVQTGVPLFSSSAWPLLLLGVVAAVFLLADLGDGAMGAFVHRMTDGGIKSTLGLSSTNGRLTLPDGPSKVTQNTSPSKQEEPNNTPHTPKAPDKALHRIKPQKEWVPPAFRTVPNLAHPVPVKAPQVNLRDHYDMSDDMKATLLRACFEIAFPKNIPFNQRKNGILLYGPPGNGKTHLVECLAGTMRVPVITVTRDKLESRWIGEDSERLQQIFEQARAYAPCILFFDEFDALATQRRAGNDGNLAQLRNEMVNHLLTELVNIRGLGVVVMAATNRLEQLDEAIVRNGRFDYKYEIGNPDLETRRQVLGRHLDEGGWVDWVDTQAFDFACERWEGFSMARMKAIGQAIEVVLRKAPAHQRIDYSVLLQALREAQGTAARLPQGTRTLDQMVLAPQTTTAIESIVGRISNPMRFESLGGTMPTGVLFHGPAGTGKTAAAKALALKSGYAFVAAAGPDFIKNSEELERSVSRAQDLRPAILFIDEADELLQERRGSQYSLVTNKMLTLMDGAGGRVKDVLFIAATNHPDLIDPAMLRAGRFTEKVPFFDAGPEQVRTLIQL